MSKLTVKQLIDKIEQYKITNHDLVMANGKNPVVYFLPQSVVDDLKSQLNNQENKNA